MRVVVLDGTCKGLPDIGPVTSGRFDAAALEQGYDVAAAAGIRHGGRPRDQTSTTPPATRSASKTTAPQEQAAG